MFGLGFTSVFEQVLEGLPEADKEAIFASYIRALEEDPAQYKQVNMNKGRGWLRECRTCVAVMHDVAVFDAGPGLGSPGMCFLGCKEYL